MPKNLKYFPRGLASLGTKHTPMGVIPPACWPAATGTRTVVVAVGRGQAPRGRDTHTPQLNICTWWGAATACTRRCGRKLAFITSSYTTEAVLRALQLGHLMSATSQSWPALTTKGLACKRCRAAGQGRWCNAHTNSATQAQAQVQAQARTLAKSSKNVPAPFVYGSGRGVGRFAHGTSRVLKQVHPDTEIDASGIGAVQVRRVAFKCCCGRTLSRVIVLAIFFYTRAVSRTCSLYAGHAHRGPAAAVAARAGRARRGQRSCRRNFRSRSRRQRGGGAPCSGACRAGARPRDLFAL